jgi:hypothetical protein
VRLCAVSIDLDELPNYFAIHGEPSPAALAHVGYDVGLPRAASFADAHGLPLTFFAVGDDLARPANAAALCALHRRGNAVENHSRSHRYDLAYAPRAEVLAEVDEGARAIEAATGERPRGFRAPGYTVNEVVLDALEEVGVAWDSSVFPCPLYYGAKALALGLLRLRGLASKSILDSPRVLVAPRRPYRPARAFHRRGGRGLVELPIQVTPRLRLPVIGTSIALAGPDGARRLARACFGEPVVNVELHLLDFLDRGDGLEQLDGQPELALPLSRRLDALAACFDALRRVGYAFVRLDDAARALA